MDDIIPENIDFKSIGLLGGSFNPSHEGHIEMSLEALKHLKLDMVWWLVSPGNPLKDNKTLPPLENRINSAQKIIEDHPIFATGIEGKLGTTYTIDTLLKLTKARPNTKFIWLMGEDNMIQFPLWKDWKKIINLLPIAVFKREGYSNDARSGDMATYFKDFEIPPQDIGALKTNPPPAWSFVPNKLNLVSSTILRDTLKKNN